MGELPPIDIARTAGHPRLRAVQLREALLVHRTRLRALQGTEPVRRPLFPQSTVTLTLQPLQPLAKQLFVFKPPVVAELLARAA